MSESVLSFSNIFLFGQKVSDLVIRRRARDVRLASTSRISAWPPATLLNVDGVGTVLNDLVLIKNQNNARRNGVYRVNNGIRWTRINISEGEILTVTAGNMYSGTKWRTKKSTDARGRLLYDFREVRGNNNQLFEQLTSPNPCLAKIYGFSYEGNYYDLARPAIFLVHGDGDSLTEKSRRPNPTSNPSRAPHEPSDIGLSVAGFQFADDIRIWFYDKGDFSIRLDVSTGMLEDILLEAEIDAHLQMSNAAKLQTAGAAKMQISHAAKMQIGRRNGG